MPIVAADIEKRLSGGAANTDPAASLGGEKSSTAVTGSTLLDSVSSAEAASGDIEYRCFYVHNAHATLTLQGAKIWIQANTPNSETTIDIGLGTSAIDGEEQTVANEGVAPTSVTFSAAVDEAGALAIGDLAPGSHKAIWIRRTVDAASSAANDTATIRIKGDTAA